MKRIVKFATPPLDAEDQPRTGMVHLGNLYYDCEERADISGGTLLGSGPDRYRDLTGAQKRDCLISRVSRVVDGKTVEARVRIRDEAGGDVVLETNIVPHKWAGEP